MPDQLQPAEIISRYRFDLSAAGLDSVRVAVFRPGKEIEPKDDSEYTAGIKKGATHDMHSNFAVGQQLSPGARGSQPISSFGTPVFADVILFPELKNPSEGVQLTWVLCTVDQTRHIVKTEILGNEGTVKEYMGDGDFQITLRGAVCRTFESSYPKREMEKLIHLLKFKGTLGVISPFLLQFGIGSLVVDSYVMAQEVGRQNLQRFEIRCSSDRPFELKEA